MRHTWREFWVILRLHNRRAELQRLVRWATRKRLPGPRTCYERHLDDVELRLFRYRVHFPTVTRWARWTHRIKCVLFPPPRYPARGSAAGYSMKNRRQFKKIYGLQGQNYRQRKYPRPILLILPESSANRVGTIPWQTRHNANNAGVSRQLSTAFWNRLMI